MDLSLANKVAVVTGTSRGIGRAVLMKTGSPVRLSMTDAYGITAPSPSITSKTSRPFAISGAPAAARLNCTLPRGSTGTLVAKRSVPAASSSRTRTITPLPPTSVNPTLQRNVAFESMWIRFNPVSANGTAQLRGVPGMNCPKLPSAPCVQVRLVTTRLAAVSPASRESISSQPLPSLSENAVPSTSSMLAVPFAGISTLTVCFALPSIGKNVIDIR